MRTRSITIPALLLSAAICLGLCGCGGGFDQGSAGGSSTQPSTVSSAVGAIATDSWGYTGVNAQQLTSPAKAQVVVEGRTLLEDGLSTVVSGFDPTVVKYSSDPTTLPSPAQVSQPGTFVSYVSIAISTAWTAKPAMTVTMQVPTLTSGQAVTIYFYDPGTGKWVSPQPTQVTSSGEVTFQAPVMSFYGVFK
ncbi:hypothetical protein [Geomonas sp.]|uniref:hypothetical protein n=1 Tax=Geomonas sp. TaxID=2651584 RepID=UPI002B46AAFB|nr:hypothetical protein [Geomonas sp.]HJV36864.1 hypothetical protein [Geomonas sp.]